MTFSQPSLTFSTCWLFLSGAPSFFPTYTHPYCMPLYSMYFYRKNRELLQTTQYTQNHSVHMTFTLLISYRGAEARTHAHTPGAAPGGARGALAPSARGLAPPKPPL